MQPKLLLLATAPSHRLTPVWGAGLQQLLEASLVTAKPPGPLEASFPLLSASLITSLAEAAPSAEHTAARPAQLTLRLATTLAAQHAAGFCLGVLRHAVESGCTLARVSQPPLSSSIAWMAAHGGVTLRTRALQACHAFQ